MALEDRVELDVDDALRRIDSIEEALNSAATRFSVALAEALDVLGAVTVGEVDASNVTSAIDAAVEAADTDTEVDADASPVTAAIDEAVDGADNQVEVGATVDGITEEIAAAVNDADTTIEIEADTTQAEDAIAGVGDAAGDATADVGGLGVGMGQLNALSEAATGSLAGLEGGLAATHPVAGAAAAGVAAVGGAALALFHAALESDTATRRFNSALGEMADRVEGINIKGFADNLGELAEKAGSDDEAMRLAAARIADLGNSAGASGPKIASTAEDILLLATRATVMNPTLGDAGDVADRMTNAFARGGRALAPFGIALSSAEINARALRDTGKTTADELTIFDKAAAGAAITTEKLGGHLKSDIVEGAKGTEISLRTLKEQFKNTLEELGKPLLEPVIEAIRAGQPILLDLAQVLGQLAEAVLPVLLKAFEAGGPIIDVLATATEGLLAVLSPLLNLIADIPAPFIAGAAAAGLLAVALPPLIAALGVGVSAAAGLASAALGFLFTPIGALTVAVGVLATLWSNHAKAQAESNARVKEGAAAFEDESKSVTDAIAAITEKRIPKNQIDDINRLGLSFKEVGTLAREGKGGLDDFIDSMAAAGEIDADVAAALKQTGGDVDELKTNYALYGLTVNQVNDENLGLVSTFTSLQRETQASAQATLEHLVATDALSGAQEKEARAALDSKDKHVDYVGVLAEVKPTSEDAATGADDLSQSLEDQATQAGLTEEALQTLLDGIMGFVNSQIAAETANIRFRDSLTEVKEKADALTKAVAEHGAASTEAARAADEHARAVQESRNAAVAAAEAAVRLAIDTGKVSEGTAGAAEQFKIYRDSLQDAANRAGGPVKEALEALIGQIDATKAAGDIRLQIDADTAAAERALESLRRKLDSMNRGLVGVTVHGASMAGGSFLTGSEGEFHVFGEAGPELAFIQPNTQVSVSTAGQTAGAQQTVGGATVTQEITINEVAGDPRATAFAAAALLGELATR